jgi:hypothetical protein
LWTLPAGWPLTSLAPVYTLPLFASGAPAPGTTRDLTSPQTYTITAQDGSTKNFTVTASNAVGAQTYGISLDTDLAQEFSPMNRSGHPIMTGLNNYPNSSAPKALVAGAMKAPWNVNVGAQTMLCSDCHDSTTTNYNPALAQGPHGSAGQYMLRGPNAANWPNVTSFAASWCANCHVDNVNSTVHTRSEHMNNGCQACHIIIPHGGKVSRLLAANRNGTLPARYAYNNNTATVLMTGINKAANNAYTESGSCGGVSSSCSHHSTGTGSESW